MCRERKQCGEAAVRSRLFGLLLAALVPLSALADDKIEPKYPPGFDCSAVAAGSHRQACNRSQLKPPMDAIPEPTRPKPGGLIIQHPPAQRLPMTRPSTIPTLPGTNNNTR
jgi:hypothetical protein